MYIYCKSSFSKKVLFAKLLANTSRFVKFAQILVLKNCCDVWDHWLCLYYIYIEHFIVMNEWADKQVAFD